ncbi:hypothetical protein MKQ70_21780 [Chitinophaga sedimenti]|uniref:hypothetical protein n=1 Tax=Chitinophaga sedimenti TaxID=2033606 RepID=UPI002003FB97|nr:hypothetical protein [Chitinophaga sedimenti]MCK7557491.1 hypothetical protein [Chitinophaga sedimenti]
MELHIAKDATQLSENLAAWTCNYILQTLQDKEIFTFVLSGAARPNCCTPCWRKSPMCK